MHTLIELLSLSILHQQTDNCGQTVKKKVLIISFIHKKVPLFNTIATNKNQVKKPKSNETNERNTSYVYEKQE